MSVFGNSKGSSSGSGGGGFGGGKSTPSVFGNSSGSGSSVFGKNGTGSGGAASTNPFAKSTSSGEGGAPKANPFGLASTKTQSGEGTNPFAGGRGSSSGGAPFGNKSSAPPKNPFASTTGNVIEAAKKKDVEAAKESTSPPASSPFSAVKKDSAAPTSNPFGKAAAPASVFAKSSSPSPATPVGGLGGSGGGPFGKTSTGSTKSGDSVFGSAKSSPAPGTNPFAKPDDAAKKESSSPAPPTSNPFSKSTTSPASATTTDSSTKSSPFGNSAGKSTPAGGFGKSSATPSGTNPFAKATAQASDSGATAAKVAPFGSGGAPVSNPFGKNPQPSAAFKPNKGEGAGAPAAAASSSSSSKPSPFGIGVTGSKPVGNPFAASTTATKKEEAPEKKKEVPSTAPANKPDASESSTTTQQTKLMVKMSDELDGVPFALDPTSAVFVRRPSSKTKAYDFSESSEVARPHLFVVADDGDVAGIPKALLLNPDAEFEEDDESAPSMFGCEINSIAEGQDEKEGIQAVPYIAQSAAFPNYVAALCEETEVIKKKKKKSGGGSKKKAEEEDEVRDYQTLRFFSLEWEEEEFTLKRHGEPFEISSSAVSLTWSPCGRFIAVQSCESQPIEKEEEDEGEDEEEEEEEEEVFSVQLLKVIMNPKDGSIANVVSVIDEDLDKEGCCFIDLQNQGAGTPGGPTAKRNGSLLFASMNNQEGYLEVWDLEKKGSKEPECVIMPDEMFPSKKQGGGGEEKEDDDEEDEEEEALQFKSMATVGSYLVVRELEQAALFQFSHGPLGDVHYKKLFHWNVPDEGDSTQVVDTFAFILARGVRPHDKVMHAGNCLTGDRKDCIFGVGFSDSTQVFIFGQTADGSLKIVAVETLADYERIRAVAVEGTSTCIPVFSKEAIEEPFQEVGVPAVALLIEANPDTEDDEKKEADEEDEEEPLKFIKLLSLYRGVPGDQEDDSDDEEEEGEGQEDVDSVADGTPTTPLTPAEGAPLTPMDQSIKKSATPSPAAVTPPTAAQTPPPPSKAPQPPVEPNPQQKLSAVAPSSTVTPPMGATTSNTVGHKHARSKKNGEDAEEDNIRPDLMVDCYGKYKCIKAPNNRKRPVKVEDFFCNLTPMFGTSELEDLEDKSKDQVRWMISRTEQVTNAQQGTGEDTLRGHLIGQYGGGTKKPFSSPTSPSKSAPPPKFVIYWHENQGSCKVTSLGTKLDHWAVDMKQNPEMFGVKSVSKTPNPKAASDSDRPVGGPAPSKFIVTFELEDGSIFEGPTASGLSFKKGTLK